MADNHKGGMVRVKLSGDVARAIGRLGYLRFRVGVELREDLDRYHRARALGSLGNSVEELLCRALQAGTIRGGGSPSRRVRETIRAELRTQGDNDG